MDVSMGLLAGGIYWSVLILDGYGSHIMCFRTLNYFVKHRVHVVCMPSHTSSLLQPLDVACFAPKKGHFKHDLHTVQLRLGSDRYIKTFQTPAIFEISLKEGCCSKNIKSGFDTCGIWPLSENWTTINRHKFQMSKIFITINWTTSMHRRLRMLKWKG